MSEDGKYLVSYTKGEISNEDERIEIFVPEREGYTFVGWTTVSGGSEAEYTMKELTSVPEGTVLYAVWTEGTELEPEPAE